MKVEGLSITKRDKETIQFGETEDGWCVRQVSSERRWRHNMGQERHWRIKILLDHVGNVKEFGFLLGITGSHFKLFNGKHFKLWNSRFDL